MGTFTTPRLVDWTTRWVEFIKDSMDVASDQVLDWDSDGITCTSWCGDGIEAITGENPFDQYRGAFSNMLGAARVIKERGFNTLDDLISSLFKEIPVGMAQAGDLVLVKSTEATEESLSIMPHGLALVDPPMYWAVTEKGLGRGDLYADGVRAFAVGRMI